MRVRDVWWGFVLAGARSKFGVTAAVLMLAAAVWLFFEREPRRAFFVLAVAVLTYARIPTALGAWIGLRKPKSNGGRQ